MPLGQAVQIGADVCDQRTLFECEVPNGGCELAALHRRERLLSGRQVGLARVGECRLLGWHSQSLCVRSWAVTRRSHGQTAGRAMDLFNIPAFRPEARQADHFAAEPLRKRPRTYTRQPCACGAGYSMALPPVRGRSCRCLASQTDGRGLVLK